MKTVIPLSDCQQFDVLAEAGTDEFYCGFVPYEWLKEYGAAIPLNRREYLNNTNICTFSSMKIIAKKMEYYKIPVKLTFNAVFYIPQLYNVITRIIQQLTDIGFSTFIISDIGLIVHLREKGIRCDIHLSGETPVQNHKAMEFLDQFNISRYIFCRKTAISVIRECIKQRQGHQNCSYESFILNSNCIFTGGFCNTIHCDEMGSFCFVPNEIKSARNNMNLPKIYRYLSISQKQNNVRNKREIADEKTHLLGVHGCGICYIKELMDAGITHLKVVGRGIDIEKLKADIINVKSAIHMANESVDAGEYQHNAKKCFFPKACPEKFCYYPARMLEQIAESKDQKTAGEGT